MKRLLLLALVAVASPAFADAADGAARAQELFRKGMAHYNLGELDAAIRDFKEAYELSQAPGLLFNLAQASRLNREPEQAFYFYKSYLRMKPEAANRPDVEARIAELEAQLRTRAPEPPAVAGTASPRPAQVLVAAPPRKLPSGRALMWAGIGTAAGGLALLATGVGLGVGATSAQSELSSLSKKNGAWSPHYQSVYDQGQREAVAASVLYGLGGAAVAAGAVMAIVGYKRDVALRRFGIAPVRGGVAMSASWRF